MVSAVINSFIYGAHSLYLQAIFDVAERTKELVLFKFHSPRNDILRMCHL
jgi:hypothetical protein